MSNPFQKPSLWKANNPAPKDAKGDNNYLLIGGAGALLLVGLVVGGLATRASPPPPPPAVAVAPTATPLVATPTANPIPTPTVDDCPGIDVYLKVITDQETNGKWQQAADNAASALNDPNLCKEDRPILAQKYVTNAMEALYAAPFSPDKADQEDSVKRYQSIVRSAARYGSELPSPLSVAQRAVQGGKFLLGKSAWDDALQEGSFSTDDISLVDAYADNLTSIGKWWTTEGSPNYQEGLACLSAANQITLKYKTGDREAWGILKQLLGNDEKAWPDPIDTPLLNR